MWPGCGKNLIMCIRNMETEAMQKLYVNEATYEHHTTDLLTMQC